MAAMLLAAAPVAAASTFGFPNVAQIAKQLAGKAYALPPTVPGFLTKLDYNEYQQIRFKPQDSLWHATDTNFQVMLMAPGEYFKYPVQISTIDSRGVHPLTFHKEWFTWPKGVGDKVSSSLGYAGFKLTFPLNKPGAHDQFLVFAGASYFRGVARNQNFGLSARGIAIDTGLPGGEEFPNFTHFWLVRPSPRAKVMKIYALLNGPSLTGAYEFIVYPGAPTRMEVHAKLFVRKRIQLLGLAPLTSMFFYGSDGPRPAGEWRPQVHDSGGLLIHSGTGEWLWRPLVNPLTLQMDYFEADAPQGFGLLQRDTRFTDYEDAEARYDNRPSAWVTTHGDWGDGHVVLVEIPTDSETNDNIVAFWSPKDPPAAGHVYDLSYTLRFGAPTIPDEPMARALQTFVGTGPAPGTHKPSTGYRVVVDFAGGGLDDIAPGAKVQAVVTGLDGTKVNQHQVFPVAPVNGWRLSIEATPAANKPLELRAFLKLGNSTLSETWSYSLPAKNRFNPKSG
ncbi:MAG TPA: glucan biosynthesis protein G [Rhodanobacteraceae bacterium]